MSQDKPGKAYRKVVLIFDSGRFSTESIKDKIAALGYNYQRILFSSEHHEWIQIDKKFKKLDRSGKLLAILMLLTNETLLFTSSEDDLKYWRLLLTKFNRSSSMIFVNQASISGKFFDYDYRKDLFTNVISY
jgi:hypothetical protein